MKKTLYFTFLVSTLVLSGCGGSQPTPQPEPPAPVKSISLDYKQLLLDLYETKKIKAFTENVSGTITWSSTDPSVATVNADGVINSLKEGNTVVSASIEDISASCAVSVVSSGTTPILELSSNEIYVGKNESFNVSAQVTYKGNPVNGVVYTWSAQSEEGVASIALSEDTSVATFTGSKLGNIDYRVTATVYNTPLVENFKVYVNDASISYVFKGFEYDVEGYKVNLATADTATIKTTKYIDVDVYDNGELAGGQELVSWTSTDSSIVTIENGYICAKGIGEAVITGTYKGHEESIRVNVTVPVKEEVTLSQSIVVDKGDSEETVSVDLSELGITGEVGSVTFKDHQLSDISYSGSTLSFSKSVLKTEKLFGDDKICAYIKVTPIGEGPYYVKVNINAKVVTKTINSKNDLNSLGSFSKEESNEPGIWDGYFILGKDIEYSGLFTDFINYNSLAEAGKSASYSTGYNGGFRGTFDGQGHIINNFRTKDGSSGLLGVICTGGVIKNVTFTNVKLAPASSLICESGNGLIENIYIDCIEQREGWGVNVGQKCGFFYTFKASEAAMIKKCFVTTDISAAVPGSTKVVPILGTVKTNDQAQDVYIVGNTVGLVQFYTNKDFYPISNNANYGAYETMASLQAAGIDFSSWNNNFYDVKNNLPVPKALSGGQITIDNDDTYVPGNSELEILTTCSGVSSLVYSLDDASVTAGFSINGNVVTIPAGSIGKSFTVSVTSKYDSSVFDQKTFEVKQKTSNVISHSVVKKSTIDDPSTTFSYDLSSLNIDPSYEFVGLKHGSKYLQGATYSSGIVRCDKTKLTGIYGEQDVLAKFNKVVGGEVTEILEVKCPTLFITKLITNSNDIDNLGSFAKAEREEGYKWGGYFLLTQNIKYQNTNGYTHFITWDILNKQGKASVYDTGVGGGFIGTIEGAGFNIDGFNCPVASNGLVGVLGTEGRINNLSFTNVVLKDAASLICASGDGQINNVYIDCVEEGNGWKVNADQKSGFFFTFKASENATINNVFVKTNILDPADPTKRVEKVGLGTINNIDNLNNVYVVGCSVGAVNYISNSAFIPCQGTDKYSAFETAQNFLDADLDLTRYPTSFWMLNDDGLPISQSAYIETHGTHYTVNHYLAKDGSSTKTQLDTYCLYTTESVAGYIGQKTQAEALTLDGFTAEPISQVDIEASGTTVNVYYTRDMLKETFDEKEVGWIAESTAKGGVKCTNNQDARIIREADGNKAYRAFFPSNAGSAWVTYYLTDEQIAQLDINDEITLRIRFENQNSESDITYSVNWSQGTCSTTSFTSKKLGTSSYVEVKVTGIKSLSQKRIQFWLNVDKGDGFYITLDDICSVK